MKVCMLLTAVALMAIIPLSWQTPSPPEWESTVYFVIQWPEAVAASSSSKEKWVHAPAMNGRDELFIYANYSTQGCLYLSQGLNINGYSECEYVCSHYASPNNNAFDNFFGSSYQFEKQVVYKGTAANVWKLGEGVSTHQDLTSYITAGKPWFPFLTPEVSVVLTKATSPYELLAVGSNSSLARVSHFQTRDYVSPPVSVPEYCSYTESESMIDFSESETYG